MPSTDATQLGFVRTIDTCGRTLLEIINHILDFSKLSFSNNVLETEVGSQLPTLEDFDVVDVAEQVLSTAFSSYEFKKLNDHLDVQKSDSQRSRSDSDSGSLTETIGRNVEVIVQVEHRSEGYKVCSDLGAYRRILLNLLGNALKYTHLGHVILRLSLLPDDSTPGLAALQIAVTDTGIGIAQSFLVEMFKPFTQEDEFSTGTGLGLSIVKELTSKMHGKIDVKTRKHIGSQFTVSIPIVVSKTEKTLFQNIGHWRDLHRLRFHYPEPDESDEAGRSSVRASQLLRNSTIAHLVSWFGMVLTDVKTAQVLVIDDAQRHFGSYIIDNFHGPILTLCSTTAKYEISRSKHSRPLQTFITKPCGPHKLGEVLSQCLALASNISRLDLGVKSPGTPSVLSPAANAWHSSDYFDSSPSPSMSSTIRESTNKANFTGGTRRSIKEEQEAENLEEMYNIYHTQKTHRRTFTRTRTSSSPVLRINGTDAKAMSTDKVAGGPLNPSTSDEQMTNQQDTKQQISEGDNLPNGTSQSIESTSASSDDEGPSKKKHILIVEDNPINMMLLVAFAKQNHLAATTAGNGKIASERVKERPKNYDAILMDIK